MIVVIVAVMVAVVPARMVVLVALADPVVADEVDRLTAGAVLAAVAAPVLLVRRRHVEIDRPPFDDVIRRRGDDHRLRQHQGRARQIADVDAAVDARLVDADRDADVGLGRGRRDRGERLARTREWSSWRLVPKRVILCQRGARLVRVDRTCSPTSCGLHAHGAVSDMSMAKPPDDDAATRGGPRSISTSSAGIGPPARCCCSGRRCRRCGSRPTASPAGTCSSSSSSARS